MKRIKSILAFILICMILLPSTATAAQSKLTKEQLLEELSYVIDLLGENYVGDEVSLTDIRDGLLHGLTQPYDDFTEYLNEDEFTTFVGDINGTFVGIGVTLSESSNGEGVVIVNVIEGSPAKSVGLQAGDQIIRINNIDFTERSFDDFINSLRGKAGTTVSVTVLRGDEEKTYDMKRSKITTPTVMVKTIAELELEREANEPADSKIRYVEINSFGDTTAKEFQKAVTKMKADGVKTIILDLRNNTGGYIATCSEMARLIVPKGIILTQKSADPIYSGVTRSALNVPPFQVIVLVNTYTISAAEILASALQDSGSLLIGQTTYGKGIGQQTVDLPLGGSLKLTTIEWFTRNGNTIQGKGITPNILIEEDLEVDNTLLRGYDEALNLSK